MISKLKVKAENTMAPGTLNVSLRMFSAEKLKINVSFYHLLETPLMINIETDRQI